jgi:hypothetical protein
MQAENSQAQTNNSNFKAKLSKFFRFRWWKLIVAIALILAGSLGFLYWYNIGANYSQEIAYPKVAHYHFRLILSVDGKEVNFGDSKFQEPYSSAICSGRLTDLPIHFHDNKNQITHIHWQGVTGGLVLKNYGLDFLGGNPDVLGYRLDNLSNIKPILITGKLLPNKNSQDKLYVYTGDDNSYQKRDSTEFLQKDLELFLKKSDLRKSNESSNLDFLTPKVLADYQPAPLLKLNETSSSSSSSKSVKTEAQLEEINDLIGNIVVFVQKDEPSDQQIKDKFNHLEPLADSVCGG